MVKLLCLAALVACASAKVVPAPGLDTLWYSAGDAADTERVDVMFSLAQRNLDVLAQKVEEVSTPSSPFYKDYWTAEQIAALTAPDVAAVERVTEFLAGAESVDVNIAQGVVSATFTVAMAEQTFATNFRKVSHAYAEGRTFIIADDYKIPDEVASVVSAIFGMHGLPALKEPMDMQPGGTPPPVTPSLIHKVYDVTGKATGGKNLQAVAEFQGQLMNESDLGVFFQQYVPDAPASDAKVNKFYGGNETGTGIEAQLDIQYIMGVAPGVKTDFYEQLNSDFCADLKNWTTLLLSQGEECPLVHSISYGWQGDLTQIGCTADEMMAVDTDFQKLAMMGISIIFASGDSGSGFAPPAPPMPPQCNREHPGTANTMKTGTIIQNLTISWPKQDATEAPFICCSIASQIGSQRGGYAGWTLYPGECTTQECRGACVILKTIEKSGPKQGAYSAKALPPGPPPPPPGAVKLYPSWPASSNYVTAVGATRFHMDVTTNPEAAVNEEDHFGSGGGFSPWTQFKIGTWQADAVSKYLSTVAPSTLPPKDSYNPQARATPDVAALGTAFQVINDGKPLPGGVGGTSASAPTFAAIVSLINDELLASGKKPLGYLNPFVYANPTAFTDITIGSDKIGRGGPPLPYGYNCSKGWDPVTGLGTPIYSELVKAAMATGK